MTQKNARDKRDRITEKAVGVFLRYGYERTTMNDIAEAVAISRPALYLVFKNKEEVFAAVVEHFSTIQFNNIRNGLSRHQTLEAKLSFACEAWAIEGYEVLAAHPDAADMAKLSYEPVQRMYAAFQQMIVELLPQKLPKTRAGYKPGEYARVLTFALRGFKETAQSAEDLRRMIRLQVSLLIAALEAN